MGMRFVRVCGFLIIFRSLTNFAKPFAGDDAVLVVFGQILRGSEAAVPAVVVGVFMLVTGIGLVRGDSWARWWITTYAVYVALNLAAWPLTNPEEIARVGARISQAGDVAVQRRVGALGFAAYAVIALVTTAGPAWISWKRRRTD